VIPPMVAWIKINWFGIWLPLFLLWPIVLALVLLILPLVFIVMTLTGRISRFWIVIRTIVAAYTMLCVMRGLQIEVQKEKTTFELYLP
jgi:hypothetical protein